MALLLIDLFGVNYELPEAFNFDMLVLVIRPAEQKKHTSVNDTSFSS